jgi:outer membrane immunogenic protein
VREHALKRTIRCNSEETIMRTIALAAAGLIAAYAGPASATDLLSTKDNGISFAQSSVVNWTGFYIQGQGGWVSGSHEPSLEGPSGTLFSFDGIASDGAIGGARLGFDVARGPYLIGIFADYNWSNAESELKIGSNTVALFEKDDEWTAGLRAGYIIAPRTLLYGLVGYTESGFDIGSASFDTQGITAGGGVEVNVGGGLALGLEASHTWYDDVTLSSGGGFSLEDELDETRILATLKLKLNGSLFGN